MDHPERLLLLDACGVLVGEPTEPLFQSVALSVGHTTDEIAAVFRHKYRDSLWAGAVSERDFWVSLAGTLGLSDAPSQWRSVIDAAMGPLPALRRLASWSQAARLVMMSNHRHEWLVPRLDALGATGHFAKILISSRTGLVKPDPTAYLQALAGAKREATLYVDDKRANIEAAQQLGIHSILADLDGDWMREVETWLGN